MNFCIDTEPIRRLERGTYWRCMWPSLRLRDTLCRTSTRCPSHFSAVALWNFRVASLGIQTVLWTIVDLLFGFLAEHVLAQQSCSRLYHP